LRSSFGDNKRYVIADKLQKMEETLQLLIDGTANIKNPLERCYENKGYNCSSLF
jgi:hypothetical protein